MRPLAEPFRSISSVVLQRIVGLALLCLVLAAGLQAWLERNHHAQDFQFNMKALVETNSQAIANALWDLEHSAVYHHMERLTALDTVAAVAVHIHTSNETLHTGIPVNVPDMLTYHSTIHAPMPEGPELGTITVWADPQHFKRRLWQSQLRVLPGYLLFTMLLCVLVTWIVRRDLGQPLREIADFANTLTPQALSQPLQLRRPAHAHNDEIDAVIQGFAHLQAALDSHIKNLDSLVQARTAELNRVLVDIKQMSETDALSGAFNRHAMSVRLPQELDSSVQTGRPLSVIFADIDHFKRINDQYGHHVGDQVIQAFVQYLQSQVRSQVDWVVRFGGEEFVVFMPGASLRIATATAQRMAQQVRTSPIYAHDAVVSITSSFGVIEYIPPEDMHSLLNRADTLLYQAKTQGRDRVCATAPTQPPFAT